MFHNSGPSTDPYGQPPGAASVHILHELVTDPMRSL